VTKNSMCIDIIVEFYTIKFQMTILFNYFTLN